MAQVQLRNITKHYGDTKVIQGINLDINDGEFIVFVGPSGCGKSTLLRMIAGLEDITDGELFIDGEMANDIPPAKRGLAMVFQSYALYPHMTVYENMAFSLKMAGQKKQQVDDAVQQAAQILQITHLLQRKPKICLAVNASGSRLVARLCVSPSYFYLMSHFPTSMPVCACRCGLS